MQMLVGILRGTVIDSSREIVLKEELDYYVDTDGNIWKKDSGCSSDPMAVWKLDTSTIKII